MKKAIKRLTEKFEILLTKMGLGMRAKLIIIFLVVKVLPLIVLTVIAWQQITILGTVLRDMAVEDSSEALNASAVENIERMTTDTALRVADFLYSRDDDILYLASIEPTEDNYRTFIEKTVGRLIEPGQWVLAEDGASWVLAGPEEAPAETTPITGRGGISTNSENNDMEGFHYTNPIETY